FLLLRPPPISTLFPYTTLFRSVMENQRDDLVVILAGYKDRMDTFFRSNPGMSSRIAHHLDFPDYAPGELLRIADKLLEQHNYRLDRKSTRLNSSHVAISYAVFC